MLCRPPLLAVAPLLFLALGGCKPQPEPLTLLEARAGFVTATVDWRGRIGAAPEVPPPELFSLVRYPSKVGPLAAYVTPRPKAPGRSPAVIWLIGGFSNSISSVAWRPAPADNDQSARAFRETGLVMLYPSLRGGNDSPAQREGFYGEVEDVLAAADYLASLDYVDPERIYLAGHSTGGTLALLAAASGHRFRAVFSFGPVANVGSYGDSLPFDLEMDGLEKELFLRSPMNFMKLIRSPTFIIEGEEGNVRAFPSLTRRLGKAPVRTFAVRGVDHFSVLAAVTPLLARKMLADDGEECSITLSARELALQVPPPPRTSERPWRWKKAAPGGSADEVVDGP